MTPKPTTHRRSLLRAWFEVRGWIGGHRAPHVEVSFVADDGVRLSGSYLPGPGGAPAVVIAHGFAAHRRKPAYARLADQLSRRFAVVSIDLRGHGRSSGRCTFGDAERRDVAAALATVRRRHPHVAVLGCSMGGTSVLHALADGAVADAAVVISTPAWLGRVDGAAMERLDRMWRSAWRRIGFRILTGVRTVPPSAWTPFTHPRDLAAKVEQPLLVVHGVDDHFFPEADADELHAAAGGPATLWREPEGFGHAEDGLTDGFVARLGAALHVALSEGRFPERDEVAR